MHLRKLLLDIRGQQHEPQQTLQTGGEKVDQKARKSKRMGHMTKEERRNNKQDTRMTVEIGKIKKVG